MVFFTFHSLTGEAGCEAFRMVFFIFHFSLFPFFNSSIFQFSRSEAKLLS